MSRFRQQLHELSGSGGRRRWLFVPYDQLTDQLGPLSREPPEELGIVLVENPWKAGLRPYHRQKLALMLSNLRHFALEQARRGVAVKHLVADGPYRSALEPFAKKHGPLRMMAAAEYELREDLSPLVKRGVIEVLPHEGWLTDSAQFEASQRKRNTFRMDAFYRHVRKQTGILMDGDRYVGGRLSFDVENREPWKGQPPPPSFPRFPADPIKEEVAQLVESRFRQHPGKVELSSLPATREDAERLWRWAKKGCLPMFGPYEDAMSAQSRGLFHTRISMLLNLHRLLPSRVLAEAAALDIPLASKEGFVRQVLGWREFVRHVHERTRGFRTTTRARTRHPGDGGWSSWSKSEWKRPPGGQRSAAPSHLSARGGLPPAYWGERSGLNCLDQVVRAVWDEGYSHHITRLMVLSNLGMLLDVLPRELTDWFWVAYVDAYDWVVEPNVLGMGTFAVGDLMVTKPYVAGARYIHRMSDFCEGCRFDPEKTCPITPLYWAFLARNQSKLSGNPRLAQVLASLRRRSQDKRKHDGRVYRWVRSRLMAGEELLPSDLPTE